MIWLADAKYYSQQLKVKLVFHRPSKSEGNESWLTWDSSPIYLSKVRSMYDLDDWGLTETSPIYLFAFSFHPSFSTDAWLPLSWKFKLHFYTVNMQMT